MPPQSPEYLFKKKYLGQILRSCLFHVLTWVGKNCNIEVNLFQKEIEIKSVYFDRNINILKLFKKRLPFLKKL